MLAIDSKINTIDQLKLNKNTINSFIKNGFSDIDKVVDVIQNEGITALSRYTGSDKKTIRTKVRPLLIQHGFLPDLPTIEEVEKDIDDTLIGIHEAATILGAGNKTLEEWVEKGKIPRSAYFISYEDLQCSNPNMQYAFKKKSIESIAARYNHRLVDIAKEVKMNVYELNPFLTRCLTPKEMEEVRLSKHHWDKSWILDNFVKLNLRATENQKTSVTLYEDVVGKFLIESIEEFLKFRLNGFPIEFDGHTVFSDGIKAKPQLETTRKILIRALYKIKCGRAGINDYWETEGKKRQYRLLTDEEFENAQEVPFSLGEFNEQDALFIKKGVEGNGITHYTSPVKAFLYYFLMNCEDDYHKNVEKSLNGDFHYDSEKEWSRIKLMKRRFDKAIKHLSPSGNGRRAKVNPENKRKKVFATRYQLIKSFLSIRRNVSGNLKYPIKYSTQILIGFLGGVRPVEMYRMEIDKDLDIELDPNHPDFGFMKKYRIVEKGNNFIFEKTSIDDPNGWGRFTLREEITKGEYSPSHPEYGTLAVPRLVDQINEYLSSLYRYSEKGTGFLFRPRKRIPQLSYSNSSLFGWLPKAREVFDFLSKEEIENFTYYETRHTVNNLIANKTLISDVQLDKKRQRVAEIHLRHSMGDEDEYGNKVSMVNMEAYQKGVTLKEYYQILNIALNFPFDTKGLIDWENIYNPEDAKELIKLTQPKKFISDEEKEQKLNTLKQEEHLTSPDFKVKVNDLNEKLDELKALRDILRHPTKAKNTLKLSGIKRTQELHRVNNEIEVLEDEKIRLIKGYAT